MGWFNSIFSGITSIVADPIKEWQKRKTLKATQEYELSVLVQQSKIEAIKAGKAQDFDLDKIAMQNMNKSWKDEIVLVIFLAPLVLAFIPGYVQNVQNGFAVIDQMPIWYMSVIVGMIIVIYGMRGMFRDYMSRKVKK